MIRSRDLPRADVFIPCLGYPCPFGLPHLHDPMRVMQGGTTRRATASSASAQRIKVLNGEQQKKRDEQREDAQRFGHGEAEDKTAKLAISC